MGVKMFPKLMISKYDGTIVLFDSYTTGTIVHAPKTQVSPDMDTLGSYFKDWEPAAFIPFIGYVKITDDGK